MLAVVNKARNTCWYPILGQLPIIGQAVKNGESLLTQLSTSSLVALIRSAALCLSEMNLTIISFRAL